MVSRYKYQKGFTIIELLVVIIVIAILAAITIIVYPQIIQRANESAVKAELAQLSKKIELYKVENDDKYPKKVIFNCTAADDTELCVEKPSQIDAMSYSVSGTRKSYALIASKGDASYYVSNYSSTPIKSNSDTNTDTDTNTIIVTPTFAEMFVSDIQNGKYIEYKNLYFNPTPPKPDVDTYSMYVIKGATSGVYNTIKFAIEARAENGGIKPMIAIGKINNLVENEPDISSIDAYIYTWENTSADVFSFGVTKNFETGWNKLEIRGTNQTVTKIDYTSLPEMINTDYILYSDNPIVNVSFIGRYCNTEPYVFKF